MTLKHYNVARLIIAMLLASFIASSFVRRDFFWPIVAMAAAILLLFFLRQRVAEVIADERDFALGGTAARWTIQIFSIVSVFCMFALYAFQDRNSLFSVIASVLAYSTCILMLLYSVVFSVLRRRSSAHA
jgi:uncharacterized membrane protein